MMYFATGYSLRSRANPEQLTVRATKRSAMQALTIVFAADEVAPHFSRRIASCLVKAIPTGANPQSLSDIAANWKCEL